MNRLPLALSLMRPTAALTVVITLALGAIAQMPQGSAQLDKVKFPNVNRELTSQFATLQRLAADKKWYEVVDACQTLVREHGDELVPIPAVEEPLATTQRFLQTRWRVHQFIAGLPAAALKLYRQRTDTAARQWFEQGRVKRDVRSLMRIAEEAFNSGPAEMALELLGDLAFEQGSFSQAQAWWRLLAQPASAANPPGLVYPDPRGETVARVRAKQIVTLLFQNQPDRVAAELESYRQAHGKVSGKLGGKTGFYAEIIAAFWRAGQGAVAEEAQEWPTFAGNPERQGALPVAISQRLWCRGPAWRVGLAHGQLLPDSVIHKPAALKLLAGAPRSHPAIVQGKVFVADSQWVRGFDLRSGRLAFQFDMAAVHKAAEAANVPATEGVRYSLTAAEDRLFARMGTPYFRFPADGQKIESNSWLVCLRLPSGAAVSPPKDSAALVAWSVAAHATPEEGWFFEGAPIVDQGSVYIAKSRLVGLHTQTALCCYGAADGQPRWQQTIGEMPELDERSPVRMQHHLLTLAGGHLLYCSHAGAVVAVETHSGKVAWAVRYPSRGPRLQSGQSSPRDLCPLVAFDQLAIAAPADAARLFCFDAFTGQSLWERSGIEVVHVLGVSQTRLVFTTPQGIRALAITTGHDTGGWSQPGAGTMQGYGRGFLAGGWVLWPTADARMPLRALDVLTGQQRKGTEAYDPGQMIHLVPGNFAYGQGCLVVATPEELHGYLPPPIPLPRPQT